MSTVKDFPAYSEMTEKFVKVCATTFGWEDLSKDTVMDVGCGRELYCAKTVLENFPTVKSIIALDSNPTELKDITFKSPRITEFLANILKRPDIRKYEGKVDKVISTNVLHGILNKEKVFKNVYRLLKPGGEAGFLFMLDWGVYQVLEMLIQDARFEAYFKDSDLYEMYSGEFNPDIYREMLEKIGFEVIKIGEEKEYFPIDKFRLFANVFLYPNVHDSFSVPEEMVHEIEESASRLYRNKFQDEDCVYGATELFIFVTKPCESDTACFCS